MKKLFPFACLAALALSCTSQRSENVSSAESDEEARQRMSMLQGVWLDDDTELPVMKVKGDTIRLVSRMGASFRFALLADTIRSTGADSTTFYIKQLSEHSFRLYTVLGDTVRLHKSEDEMAVAFDFSDRPIQQPTEVVQKDSILTFEGKRYRGYVYINPSTRKVVVPETTEEGLTVNTVYYDNVIHICVYQGRDKLFSKDITKDMFKGIVPDSYLQGSILNDMEFMRVDAAGYTYRASVCSASSRGMSNYYVTLHISKDGTLSYTLNQ